MHLMGGIRILTPPESVFWFRNETICGPALPLGSEPIDDNP
jgi:hypothetical protein